MAKKRQRHSMGDRANQASSQPSPKKQKLGDGHPRQPGPSIPSADTNGEGQNRTGSSDDRKAQEQNSVPKNPPTEAPTHLSRKQRKRWRKRLEEAGEAAAAQYAAQAFAEGNFEQGSNQSPVANKVVDSARKPISKELMRKVTATTLATPPRKRWIEMDAQPSRRLKHEDGKGIMEAGNSSSARKGESDQAEPASKDALLQEDVTKTSEVAPTSQPLANSASNSSGNSQVQRDTAPVGKLPESVVASDERSSTPKKTTNEDASDDSDNETDDASDESSNRKSKGALPGSARLSTAPPQSEGVSTNSDTATSSEIKANAPATAAPEKSLPETLRTTSEIPYSSSVRTSPVPPSLSSFGASLRNSYGGPGGSLAFTAPVGTKPTSVPTTNVREDVRTVFDRFSAFVSGHDGGDSDDDEDDDDDESSSDESDVVKDARPASGQTTGVPLDEKSRASSVKDGQFVAATQSPGSLTVEKEQQNHQQDAAEKESADDESDAESESADSDSSKSTTTGTKPMPQLDGAGSGASDMYQRNTADDPHQSSVETESESEETDNAAVVPARQQKSNAGRERQPIAVETAVEGDGANVECANDNTPEVVDVQDQMSTSTTPASNAGEGNYNVRNENEEQSLHQNDSAGETESEAEKEEPSLDIKPASPAKYDIHDSVGPDGRPRTGTRSQSLHHPKKARTTSPLQKGEPSMQTNDQPTSDPSRSPAELHTDGTKTMTAARDQSAKPKGADQAAASDDSSESDSGNDENWPSLLLHRSSVSHSSPQATRSQHCRDHEPDSERDSGSGEDDTPASQIQRELGQEQTDPASSGTVLVPDSTYASQQIKGANGDVVDNQSDEDDDETDDADAKVQSSQADKGRAETAQAPTAFTPINAAAEAHSQANIASRSTGARPNNKKQISFLDQRPGSAPSQPATFPDRMEDDDINQTIDEISRDVLKNSTRPLPPIFTS
ncbi:hypothetical protein KC318_g4320 [Hortaea werneckii]|nr:hypothetical protein KC355_g4526 [Hortaea werneckii]KAI7669945.1 hypothetical protein KC318_g4320 [Hortaea werneckii]